MATAVIILLLILHSSQLFVNALYRCPGSIAFDGQNKVTLSGTPSDKGFIANWVTHDTNYVDLVNLEWICYPKGTTTTNQTNVFVPLSERVTGTAEIAVEKSPSLECKISGCFTDWFWGDVHSIESVTVNFDISSSTISSSSLSSTDASPLPTPSTSISQIDTSCSQNSESYHIVQARDANENLLAPNNNYLFIYVIIGILGIVVVLLIVSNILIIINMKMMNKKTTPVEYNVLNV